MKKLAAELKDGIIRRAYLFFGNERFLCDTYEKKLKEAVIGPDASSMNMDVFPGKSPISDIFDALETMPFFSEYRLVLVKDSGLFAAGRKNDSAEAVERLKSLPDTGVLVFVEENVDKRSSMYKAMQKLGYCVEFSTPSEGDMATWIMREMKRMGVSVDKESALHLSRIGDGMQSIMREMEKLSAYCKEKGAADKGDIDAVCTKSLEARVFSLVDHIARKNSPLAFQTFESLMAAKEPPVRILSLIARQFRLMLQCRKMKGSSVSEISQALGTPPFVIRECVAQGANFSESGLMESLKDCLNMDTGIKSGKIADRTALEIIIAKYAAPNVYSEGS